MRENRLTSITIHITRLSNQTTGTPPIKNPERVKFIEYNEERIKIETPKGICAAGHKLLIDFKIEGSNLQETELTTTAKVEEIENLDGGKLQLVVKLHNFDIGIWDDIKKCFENLRNDVETLFDNMRGSDPEKAGTKSDDESGSDSGTGSGSGDQLKNSSSAENGKVDGNG